MMIGELLGLKYDPFAAGSSPILTGPVKAAFAQIVRELGSGSRAAVITGAAGAGKSLLLTLIEESYSRDGCSVSRIDLAALVPPHLDEGTDLLLVDEADSADPSVLQGLLAKNRETLRAVVLACRSEAAARLCHELSAVPVHVTGLSPAQAKDFIIARVTKAGRADLFTPAALDRLIEASGGSPQALRVVAGMAMFLAAYAQAAQIEISHVEEAMRSQSGPVSAEASAADGPGEAETNADEEPGVADDAAPDDIMLLEDELPAEQPAAAPLLTHVAQIQTRAEERAASASLADVVFERRPEARPRNRAFPKLAAAAVLLAAIPVSASVWFRTEAQQPAQMTQASVTRPPITRSPSRSPADNLRALERVAQAVMPGRVVIALVPAAPLQQVSIGDARKDVAPPPQTQRRDVTAVASAAATAIPPSAAMSIAGSQAIIAPTSVPPPAAGRAPLSTEREPALGIRRSPSETFARNEDNRGFTGAPSGSASSGVRPKYLTANAMALALLDIAEQAGLRDDDEFTGFRACVFQRVSPGAAEYSAFWRAVQQCIR